MFLNDCHLTDQLICGILMVLLGFGQTERTGTESESKRERSRRMDEQSDHLSPPIAVRRSSIPHRRTHLTGVSDRIVESLTAPHKTADLSTVKSRRYVYFDSPLLVHSS